MAKDGMEASTRTSLNDTLDSNSRSNSPATSVAPIVGNGTSNNPRRGDSDNSTRVRRRLFISHFLSTWNSRVFEFCAPLLLAFVFPHTLAPASLYALARAASIVLFSTFIGNVIDQGERMSVVRGSIIGQRVPVAISCVLFWVMITYRNVQPALLYAMLAASSVLACVEKVHAVMNTIAIERDWVVVVAGGNEQELQALNSQMRRIDLFCKLVGPLVIALIDGFSPRLSVAVILGMTCVSLPIEYFAIMQVFESVRGLQTPRVPTVPLEVEQPVHSRPTRFLRSIKDGVRAFGDGASYYIQQPACLPSFSLSLLYLTVLSFGGQMIVFLIDTGVTSTSIGLLRTVSTACELSATWLAPRLMNKIGAVRAGIWLLNWQIICVGVAVAMLWLELRPLVAAAGLVAAVTASRVGLWGFDLCAQLLIQEGVAADQRGSFSATEASIQNAFELLSFLSTVIFARPNQFKFPATISASAVALAGCCYAYFVRQRRGHLLHSSKCLKARPGRMGTTSRRARTEWEPVSQQETEDNAGVA